MTAPDLTTSLITGGAGFVGTNLAARLLSSGERVVVLDDLSRPGVERNLQWLRATHPDRLQVVEGDVRDADDVRVAAREADRVFHFAAQVAVTTSVTDPVHDYSVNLGGTITLLEELRRPQRAAAAAVHLHEQGVRQARRPRRSSSAVTATSRPTTTARARHRRALAAAVRQPYGCSKGGPTSTSWTTPRPTGCPTWSSG
jgi:CDP-paratose 2-epimerase